MATAFEDEHILRKIRQCLWAGREFGRAAIMVGAGFSRNADRTRTSTSPFPLWSDLAKFMHAELYPSARIPDAPDALKLADEYEHVFKRAGLEDFLLRTIDDSAYVPGSLHRKLLSLPWADVFTTNYDTLLGRAGRLPERKYTIVNTSKDIAAAQRPRIINLHGSFPSHRPFIFTSEDYRTYPVRFAPFVNTVQQSMMENAFCLIGFSGDDPNFKAWVGWINDNLGSSAPPIYMFGLLDLDTRQRVRLEHLNVVPIDIGPMFPRSKSPTSTSRYLEGLHWLLDRLGEDTDDSPDEWPHLREDPPEIRLANDNKNSPATLLITQLKDLRDKYPGWLSCPTARMAGLFIQYRTIDWDAIVDEIAQRKLAEQLESFAVFNWFHQVLRLPISQVSSLHCAINGILERSRPTAMEHRPIHLADIQSDSQNGEQGGIESLEGKDAEHWVQLAFGALRECAEAWEVSRFEQWSALLDGLVAHHRTWALQLCLERARLALARLDYHEVRVIAEALGTSAEDPSWTLYRIALAAEVNYAAELAGQAQDLVQRIREMMPNRLTDYYLPSLEGSAMFNLWHLEHGGNGLPRRNRWAALDAFDCNPLTELRRLQLALIENNRPEYEVVSSKSFEPMRYDRRTRKTQSARKLVAFQSLRWIEDSGYPVRWGHSVAFQEILKLTCSQLFEALPSKSLSVLCRTGDLGVIEGLVSRSWVMRCAPQVVASVTNWGMSALESFLRLEPGDPSIPLQGSSFRCVLEIVSRLFIRSDGEHRARAFDLLCKLISRCRSDHKFGDLSVMSAAFARLLEASDYSENEARLMSLVDLPMVRDERAEWRDPLVSINFSSEFVINRSGMGKTWQASIRRLLRQVALGEKWERDQAIQRLIIIAEHSGLSDEEQSRFGESVWERCSGDFPEMHGLSGRLDIMVKLPPHRSHDILEMLRSLVSTAVYPPPVTSMDFNGQKWQTFDGGNMDRVAQAASWSVTLSARPWDPQPGRIEWTSAEAIRMFHRLRSYISLALDLFTTVSQDGSAFNAPALSDLGRVLRHQLCYAVAPFVDKKTLSPGAFSDLQGQIDRFDGGAVSWKPFLLLWSDCSMAEAELNDILAQAMLGGEENEIIDGCAGLVNWLALGSASLVAGRPSSDLIDGFVHLLTNRECPFALSVLQLVSSAIRFDAVQCFSERHDVALMRFLERVEHDWVRQNEVTDLPSQDDPPWLEARGDYLAKVVSLAVRLQAAVRANRGAGRGAVVERIIKLGAADSWPEVRRAARSNDD